MIYAILTFIVVFGGIAYIAYNVIKRKQRFIQHMSRKAVMVEDRATLDSIVEDCEDTLKFLEFCGQYEIIDRFEKVVEFKKFSFNKPTFTDEFFEEEAS